MLINPGFIESNTGSGGGYYFSENLVGWDQNTLDNFEFYKLLKDLLFVIFVILIFIFALYLRKRNHLKITYDNNKKPNLFVTILFIFISIITIFIALGAIFLTLENNFIWEGG